MLEFLLFLLTHLTTDGATEITLVRGDADDELQAYFEQDFMSAQYYTYFERSRIIGAGVYQRQALIGLVRENWSDMTADVLYGTMFGATPAIDTRLIHRLRWV